MSLSVRGISKVVSDTNKLFVPRQVQLSLKKSGNAVTSTKSPSQIPPAKLGTVSEAVTEAEPEPPEAQTEKVAEGETDLQPRPYQVFKRGSNDALTIFIFRWSCWRRPSNTTPSCTSALAAARPSLPSC